ncbi:hypothetical protein DEO72_LG2g920 [Vigna unguiculata]|uniref:Uncharacterized protein n=1 Tax=Vigna unguiculata TaxID=3917 RepID=A0A4D6KSE6_VIGUN|nr:hypothetical protein DEO72_LG2g920 [Vigna unguiculata]
MELQIPIHTVLQMPSLLQAVAADTILAAAQSMALIGYLLSNITNPVSPNLIPTCGSNLLKLPLRAIFFLVRSVEQTIGVPV